MTNSARRHPRWRDAAALALLLTSAGCPSSPEADRARGGGRGADGGNYLARPVPAPSKINGTKDLDGLNSPGRP